MVVLLLYCNARASSTLRAATTAQCAWVNLTLLNQDDQNERLSQSTQELGV
jgi:hypothetical protein